MVTNMMKDIKLIEFTPIEDERGSLISLERSKDIPLNTIKRVYYLYNLAQEERRGFHAHRNLEQILVCINGKCCISVDDGHIKKDILLDSPTKGLYIGAMIWREMHGFSPDCVLMVLANQLFDEEDYIRDYKKFSILAKEGVISDNERN